MPSTWGLRARYNYTSVSSQTKQALKLFYRKYGEGPPLVILHGLYGSSDNWMTVAKKIGTHFTVYIPDLRNHGNSPHDPDHSFEAMAGDLHEMAEDNGLKKFFLAGHSMGGKTAILFALRWPRSISGLLAADISPFTNEDSVPKALIYHKHILGAVMDADISGVTSRAEAEALLSGRIISQRDRALVMKNLRRNSDNSFSWKINAPALHRHLREMIEGLKLPPSAETGITGFPVIFLKGEKSEYLNHEHYNDILRIFPQAEFRLVRNAGHWIHADNPDAVTEALLDMLR